MIKLITELHKFAGELDASLDPTKLLTDIVYHIFHSLTEGKLKLNITA
jgi:hypothetical protein